MAQLLHYAENWGSKTIVRNVANEPVFVTRYCRAQEPPRECQSSLNHLAHYVSLVPLVKDWQFFPPQRTSSLISTSSRWTDVWTTSQEFLDLKAGDVEEHAILLRNYFHWYDRNIKKNTSAASYLILGSGLPEGPTVYVLHQEPQEDNNITPCVVSTLWNPITGRGYATSDLECPLQRIFLLISPDQVWANQTPEERPSNMDWTNPGFHADIWKPFFGPKGFNRDKKNQLLATVQVAKLCYRPTNRDLVVQLEAEIQETLKSTIRRQRSRQYVTAFNNDVGFRLRKMLERCEACQGAGLDPTKESDFMRDLQPLMQQKRVFGVPLHMTYTDMEPIVEAVLNTHIHWNAHPKVEFGLAIYLYAYPNDVISVWVYLASLTPL